MITVVGMWEVDWFDADRTERRLWKQSIQAFAVDRWLMAAVQPPGFTSPEQYPTLQECLDSAPGHKTFVIPPGRFEGAVDMIGYAHPADAIYVFGNSAENLVGFVGPTDDVITINTPTDATMFASGVLVAVLYDKLAKA